MDIFECNERHIDLPFSLNFDEIRDSLSLNFQMNRY